jgi:hypothetical protein
LNAHTTSGFAHRIPDVLAKPEPARWRRRATLCVLPQAFGSMSTPVAARGAARLGADAEPQKS